jgi:hypothetical protein
MWRFLTDDNTNMSYTPKFIKRNHKEIRTWSILTLLLFRKSCKYLLLSELQAEDLQKPEHFVVTL